MDKKHPLLTRTLVILVLFCLLPPFLSKTAIAEGVWPCYYYGTFEDGHEGKPTAFASWHSVPRWLPLEVRPDWPGVAVQGYPPGTFVRLTIEGLPGWASEELREALIGRSVVAVVADRPGGDYVDCWPTTFARLTGGRMWVGLVYVAVEEVGKGKWQ